MSDERRARQAQKKLAEATPSIVRQSVLLLRKKWKTFLRWLGAASLVDILKELVRGKLEDQIYVHLGSVGRWLLAYPLAFFTLGLCVAVAIIIGATIKESRKSEDSEICDEQGIPYERQSVSPKWTRGLVCVGIVCMGVILYGTYRYYQISVGHFKVNENTNIQLPRLPLSPPAPAPENPPSLADVFDQDFPDLWKAKNDLTIEGTNVFMKQQIYLDFLGKAKFVGFYIPASNNPISGVDTVKVAVMLIDEVKPALDGLSKRLKAKAGFGDDEGNTIEELTFTGRVLIYHMDSLSIVQKAELIKAYSLEHLDVQFRGDDYLAYQTNLWRQRRDSKQSN